MDREGDRQAVDRPPAEVDLGQSAEVQVPLRPFLTLELDFVGEVDCHLEAAEAVGH